MNRPEPAPSLVSGLISIAFGIVLFASPGIGAVTIALLFGLYNLVYGIWASIQGVDLRRVHHTVESQVDEQQPQRHQQLASFM